VYELALTAGELRHLHSEVLAIIAVLRQPSKRFVSVMPGQIPDFSGRGLG
jgi:hypothetical protein